MKLNPKTRKDMRRRMDEQLRIWQPLLDAPRPRKGWLKSVREALGISSRQMARFLAKSNADILAIEKREMGGNVTLETLEKAAAALGCRLVYAIVPEKGSLRERLDDQAKRAAERLVQKTRHSMRLEDQDTSDNDTQRHIEELASELKEKFDPRLWSET